MDVNLDARGLYCPEPVMLLHKKVRDIQVGDCIKILATDPSTQRDIPKFCQFLGHKLIESSEQGVETESCFIFKIQKN